jgi:hypothetical protein
VVYFLMMKLRPQDMLCEFQILFFPPLISISIFFSSLINILL